MRRPMELAVVALLLSLPGLMYLLTGPWGFGTLDGKMHYPFVYGEQRRLLTLPLVLSPVALLVAVTSLLQLRRRRLHEFAVALTALLASVAVLLSSWSSGALLQDRHNRNWPFPSPHSMPSVRPLGIPHEGTTDRAQHRVGEWSQGLGAAARGTRKVS